MISYQQDCREVAYFQFVLCARQCSCAGCSGGGPTRVWTGHAQAWGMEKLPEHALLRVFSYLPSVGDLVRSSMVCKKWRHLLDSTEHPWEQALSSEVPQDFISDKLVQNLTPKSKFIAYMCTWSEEHHSKNIEMMPNKLTLHRRPVAQSTDAIRGKRGFSHGQHYWVVIWHGPSFGSNAVVGIAIESCRLQGKGYYSLLGSDSNSWGWDLSKRQLQHHGRKLGSYPQTGGVEVRTGHLVL